MFYGILTVGYRTSKPLKGIKKVFFMDLMRWFYSFNGFDFLFQYTSVKIDTSKKKIPIDSG